MTADNIKILMVDDDIELGELVKEYLINDGGFDVNYCFDSLLGVELATTQDFDVIILDVGMPKLNGFDALKQIRLQKLTPVLMLTARGDHIDRVIGLEIGADDYLPKPCNLRELSARIKALHRRSSISNTSSESTKSSGLCVGDLCLMSSSQTVTINDDLIGLTGAEFLVLEILIQQAGQVVEKNDIAQHALDRPITFFDRSVDVHVGNLRKKLGPLASGQQRIKTVRGRGYLYVSD